MSIRRKALLINIFMIIGLSILLGIVIFIMIFVLQKEYSIIDYLLFAGVFLIIDRIITKIQKKMWFRLYSKYMNVLNEELDPEKFIKLTESEYSENRNRRYRNYMRMNFCAGYSSLGEFEKAYEYLSEIDFSKRNAFRKQDMIMYYFNKALLLDSLEREEEAKEVYEKNLLNEKKKFTNNKKINEINALIDSLEGFLFYKDDNEKMIEILSKILREIKVKRYVIAMKHELAVCKEKIGEIYEAKSLYEEVAREGNKLYIVNEARKKLEILS